MPLAASTAGTSSAVRASRCSRSSTLELGGAPDRPDRHRPPPARAIDVARAAAPRRRPSRRLPVRGPFTSPVRRHRPPLPSAPRARRRVSSRVCPGAAPSWIGPTWVRTSRVTGCPTAVQQPPDDAVAALVQHDLDERRRRARSRPPGTSRPSTGPSSSSMPARSRSPIARLTRPGDLGQVGLGHLVATGAPAGWRGRRRW